MAVNTDRIGELKDAMLKHESIEKAKRIYRKQHRARDNDVDDAAEQYCEFMCIKVKSADFSARLASLSPGGKVDLFWHVHLLDTRGYIDFFASSDVPMVHHDAEKSDDPKKEIEARQKNTKGVYRSIFGRECPFFDDEYDKQDDEESDEEPVQVPSNQPRPNRDVVVKSREIYVKLVNGKTVAMDLYHFDPSDTIDKLLHKIAAEQGSPPNQLRLFLKDVNSNLVDGP